MTKRKARARPRSTASLDLLVSGLFDYAGMFPPAALPFSRALWESARLTNLRRPYLVGNDMVVPAAELRLLSPQVAARAGFGDTLCKVCIVNVGVDSLDAAVDLAIEFNHRNAPTVQATALEVHGDAFNAAQLQDARRRLAPLRLFVEPRWTAAQWRARRKPMMLMMRALQDGAGLGVGLKIRRAGAFNLDAATLAAIVADCADLGIPLKATQGLHDPLARRGAADGVGFVGLAAALRLRQRQRRRMGLAMVERCLRERARSAFKVGEALEWRGFRMTGDELAVAKTAVPFSIGSCTLAEPDDGLARVFG
jgi:hypothetical protein